MLLCVLDIYDESIPLFMVPELNVKKLQSHTFPDHIQALEE